MAIHIQNDGNNNVIKSSKDFLDNSGGEILLTGDNNTIFIDDDTYSTHISINCRSGANIFIGKGVNLARTHIALLCASSLTIGNHTAFMDGGVIFAHELQSISIGESCLIGQNLYLTVSDMHSIVDNKSGRRINPAKPVIIEDKVWISEKVAILKGSKIGSGSIIGRGSTVTGVIPPNTVAVGSPARVVKENVSWVHELI